MNNKNILGVAASLILAGSLTGTQALAANGPIDVPGTNFTINIVDPIPELGFSDPTPADPVGGNPGTTIGDQRREAYKKAAEIWSGILGPQIRIVVQATFAPLECEADGGVLGAAGAIQVWQDFGGNSFSSTWYNSALANELAGVDLGGADPDPGFLEPPFADEIVSLFNSELGKEGCIEDSTWYYGFDHNGPTGSIDFLNVLTHELGHGLGFQSFADESTGENFLGFPDMWTRFQRDNQIAKDWGQMIDFERFWSATNVPFLVWTGPNVYAEAPNVLGPQRAVQANSPEEIAGNLYAYGTAAYGPPVPEAGVTGDLVLVNDGVDTSSDGCEPITDDLTGKIALIDRGTCNFTVKSKNAQDAGATAVIIANNNPVGVPPLGGDDDGTFTIPTVGVTQEDGAELRAYPDTNVTVGVDVEGTLSGADDNGFVKLYAPFPPEPGSSVSHFDVTASPNLLMEPFVSGDLAVNDPEKGVDLTDDLLFDIGWDGNLNCPIDADSRETVILNGCDTGVENRKGAYTVFPSKKWIFPQPPASSLGAIAQGCYLADLVHTCSSVLVDALLGRQPKGQYQSCIVQLTKDMAAQGIISSKEVSAIRTCSAQTN